MARAGMVDTGMARAGTVGTGTVHTGTASAGTVCTGTACRVVCIFPVQESDADYLDHQLEKDRVLPRVTHAEAGTVAVVPMVQWVYLARFSGQYRVADEGGAT